MRREPGGCPGSRPRRPRLSGATREESSMGRGRTDGEEERGGIQRGGGQNARHIPLRRRTVAGDSAVTREHVLTYGEHERAAVCYNTGEIQIVAINISTGLRKTGGGDGGVGGGVGVSRMIIDRKRQNHDRCCSVFSLPAALWGQNRVSRPRRCHEETPPTQE